MAGVDKMSNKLFTKKEIEILGNNKYVKSVSSKGITYTEIEVLHESEKPEKRRKPSLGGLSPIEYRESLRLMVS